MNEVKFNREYKIYDLAIARLTRSSPATIDLIEKDGYKLHLVGEKHGFRDAVEYVHRNVVPLIKAAPEQWMLIREGLDYHSTVDSNILLDILPDVFYFKHLPMVLNIPVNDSIGTITDPKVQRGISKLSDLTIEEMRGWYITCYIDANRGSMSPEDMRKNCAFELGVGLKELDEAVKFAFDRGVHERLITAWNKSSKQELEQILKMNPTRKNILVSVGAAHLPAFSDRHTFIG